jgi:hypothetical protein
MKRWMRQPSAILSALAIATFAILWVRSYTTSDCVYHCDGKGTETKVYACEGKLIWRTLEHPVFDRPALIYHRFNLRDADTNVYLSDNLPSTPSLKYLKNWIVFRRGPYTELIPISAPDMVGVVNVAFGTWTDVPIWVALLLAATPLAAKLVGTWRSRHFQSRGLCTHCSYDLRAHRPGDKCPECGTPTQNP